MRNSAPTKVEITHKQSNPWRPGPCAVINQFPPFRFYRHSKTCGRDYSLILSARMRDKPDKPVETIEISLVDGRILQCFGPCNTFTEYHQEILDLVNANSRLFLQA